MTTDKPYSGWCVWKIGKTGKERVSNLNKCLPRSVEIFYNAELDEKIIHHEHGEDDDQWLQDCEKSGVDKLP